MNNDLKVFIFVHCKFFAMSIKSINPYNNQVLKEFDEISDRELNGKLEKAEDAFKIWKKTSFDERASLMSKGADLLRRNKQEYAKTITLEMGKVIAESVAEIEKCALVCDYYAENAEKFLSDEPVQVEDGDAYIAYDPIGPVLAIMPWNFPFWQVFRFAAPNLMAGNTGLLKHASNVPQCSISIEKIFMDAGFPEGVFQALLASSSRVDSIIDHGVVKAVTITGSDKAGRKVAEQAGKNLKKTVLELGGSDSYIVLADADLKNAAQTAVRARMLNCGQSCIAAKRFIVEKSVADDFVAMFQKGFTDLKFGDPMKEDSKYGPMARKDLARDLEGQVKTSVEKGAEIIYGKGIAEDEIFFHPTILTNIKKGMPAYDEEFFGPVALLFVADNENEAIHLANQSPFGLGASLWTEDRTKGKKMARQIEAGSVFINGMVASHPKMPFGGIKISGYGRELSEVGIKEFMNIKSIWTR
jgi:succinate-semialdehyde dehydrogenase / glutarate-semialdehyde dehydrogenase